MNLDVLANNPPWAWYMIIGGPILGLVLIVWMVFKHSPVYMCLMPVFLGMGLTVRR